MTSQIRVDEITNRSGLGTVTIYDNGFEFTGVTTFTEDVDITGGLTIGGVLTYEDVTNIDSVGVVTARGGLDVSDTGTPVNIDSTNSGLNKIHFKTGGTTSGYLGNSSVYFLSLSDSSGNQRVRHANSGLYQVLDTSGNVIHQMSGTGTIGIGTAPFRDLTVLTNGNGYFCVNGSGGNGAELLFHKKSDKSQTYSIQNNGGSNELVQHVLASTSGQYSWFIGGQSTSNLKLRLTSAGRLGIGTDNPGSKLTVWADDGVTDRDVFQVRSKTGAFNIQVSDSDAANPEWSLRTYANEPIVFKQATTERLRIDSDGQVQIGSGTIHGGGHLTIRGGGVNTYACQDNQYVGTPSSNDTLSQIRFTANTSGASVITGARIQAAADAAWSATGDAPTRLQFFTCADGSASQTERLRITSAGNVGINETSPAYKLSVKDGDIATLKNVSASGGNAVNMLRFRVENSANTATKATLGGISAETVSNWGGALTFHTKDANGTPNDTVTERLRITDRGYLWIQNQKTTSFTNNSTVTILTIGSHNNAVVKFIVQASDTGYRQNEWAGEYTAFVSDANGSPGVSYYLKEHWQDVGSGNWNSPVVTVSINSSGQVQFNATNSNSDANGTVYVSVLSVTSISSTIPTIS